MRFKNVSPHGALVVPALREAAVEPDEVVEAEGEIADAFEADTVNWQAQAERPATKPDLPAAKKEK